MERSAAGYNMARGQTHRAPAGKQPADGGNRLVVAGTAVERHHHGAVADIEIHGIGGDQLALLVLNAPRRRHGDNLQLASARVVRCLEVGNDRLQGIAVGIVVTRRLHAGDHARRHKARDIVHMAVGVIVGQAIAEPDELSDAECLPQAAFDLAWGQARDYDWD